MSEIQANAASAATNTIDPQNDVLCTVVVHSGTHCEPRNRSHREYSHQQDAVTEAFAIGATFKRYMFTP